MVRALLLLAACVLQAPSAARGLFLAPAALADDPDAEEVADAVNTADDTDDGGDTIADVEAQLAAVRGAGGDLANDHELTDELEGRLAELKKTSDFDHHCTANQTAALAKAKALADKKKPQATPQAKMQVQAAVQGEDVYAERMAATDRKQLVDNEEFLLGLLIMHQTKGDWTFEQGLDAVCSLAGDSQLITRLYWHHDASKPLAAQFADMMDQERKSMAPTRAPPMDFDAVASMVASVTAHGPAKKA